MADVMEWQKEIAELIEGEKVDDAIKKAKETAQKTGEHDEVARVLIGIGEEIGARPSGIEQFK